MEAALLACPAVVSSGTAMECMIADGVTGLVFKRGDSELLAKKIKLVCSDRDLAVWMGAEARKRALKEYTPMEHYKRIMKVYTQVIEEDTFDS